MALIANPVNVCSDQKLDGVPESWSLDQGFCLPCRLPSKSNHETKSLLEATSIPSCLSSPGGAKTAGPTGPQHAGAYPRRRLESGVQAAQPGLSVCCFESAKS